MGFSRQGYWGELPCPPPGDLPDPRIEPTYLISPELAGGFFITSATWNPLGKQEMKNFCSISRVPAMWDRKFLEVLCTILSLNLTVLYCIHKFHTANSCCSFACLFWDPMNCSPTGSSSRRIFQARKLEWVVISSSRVSSLPGSNPHLLGRQIPYHWATREALKQECAC